MMLHYLIWKPLAAKSTAVFNFSAFEMYTYKSMISHKTTNGILVNFEKLIILNYDFLYAAIEIIQFHVLFKHFKHCKLFFKTISEKNTPV